MNSLVVSCQLSVVISSTLVSCELSVRHTDTDKDSNGNGVLEVSEVITLAGIAFSNDCLAGFVSVSHLTFSSISHC